MMGTPIRIYENLYNEILKNACLIITVIAKVKKLALHPLL